MSSVDTEELENSQFLSMRDSTVPIPVDNFFTAQILISNDLFMDTIIFREDNHTYRILNYSNSLDAIRSDGIILKNVPTGFFRERTDVLQLPVGSRVLVCRTKKPYWKIGEISGFSDDFYVVLYDDNEYEYNVNAMNVISLFIPLQYYSLNQNVLAKFNYHSSWLPAKILSLDLQNRYIYYCYLRYTLKFDNGVVKSEFHANYIKPNFVKKPVVFQTQDRVEVLYLNSKYYSGYIYDIESSNL